jgi:glycosyltransferase involved in cell wall biosynthesis
MNFIFADIPNMTVDYIDSPIYPYVTSESYETSLLHAGSTAYGRNLFEEVHRYALKAREIAKKVDANIIHAHDWLSFGAGIEAQKVKGVPFVAHMHATEYDRTGHSGVNPHVYNVELEGMKKAAQVVAVSNLTRGIITNKYGIDSAKVRVIHNGIDASDYNTSYDGIWEMKKHLGQIILFAGRITLQKGPDYFLKAAKIVSDFYPDVKFVIAGAGDMQPQIMKMTAEYGLSDKILYTGFLRDAELNQMYKLADLFVLPSVSEPFGITPLESLINGTPVLVSKQSGVSEVLSHALKTDFWDVEDMANKMIAVLQHQSLQQCLTDNGRGEAYNQKWDKAAHKTIEMYSQLLN